MVRRKIGILILVSLILVTMFVFLGVNSDNWSYFSQKGTQGSGNCPNWGFNCIFILDLSNCYSK